MKKKDNGKLGRLKSQMKDMSQDYEDMIKAREQSKKQLEARFNDVYSKIEENKQFTIAEGARVMQTLTAFQEKFEGKLQVAEAAIQKDLDVEKNVLAGYVVDINKKLDVLDKTLATEKQERIRQAEESLAPIKKDLEGVVGVIKGRTEDGIREREGGPDREGGGDFKKACGGGGEPCAAD